MTHTSKLPIYLSSGKNFTQDEGKAQKYKEVYERSKDEALQYVTALIYDESGAILVGYNKKHQSWQIPSGKVDKGESFEDSLKRELKEELDVELNSAKYIGTSKVILNGFPRQGHFYKTTIQGTAIAKEFDTVEEFKRINYIQVASWLGFGLTDGLQTITNPSEILRFWHMFAEVYWLLNTPNYENIVKQAELKLPRVYQEEKQYIQYRDTKTTTFIIEGYENFKNML